MIDGDQFVFTATVAIEHETRWDDQNHVLFANAEMAWNNFTGMIDRIFERFETKDHALIFSGANNFRYGVDPTYKSNRKDQRKPLCYAQVREWCDEHYNTLVMEGLEADDVMGILATKPGSAERIIVSQDKDMKTIPTAVWDGKDLRVVTLEEADRNHLYQTLIGDSTDGYKGCPGAGDVSASEFLDEPFIWTPFEHTFKSGPRKGLSEQRWAPVPTDDVWAGVVSFYVKAGLTEADALQQARLARILRWTDWDSDSKKPILWTP